MLFISAVFRYCFFTFQDPDTHLHALIRIKSFMDIMGEIMYEKNERLYICELCKVKGLNGGLGRKLIDYFGSAKEFFKAGKSDLEKLLPPSLFSAVMLRKEKMSDHDRSPGDSKSVSTDEDGIKFITYDDEEYPGRLKDISDAPLGIWYKGDLPSDEIPSVAIIGSRQCSPYGEHIAAELGAYLGKNGIQVISGMARGVDGISQRAATQSGGSSFAVLGCGADICYPVSNYSLYKELASHGGIISTYPNGEPPLAANFPPRNRIVSGLSDAVVVVEARQKSGTLITVDTALEQGRDVFAVPGRITDRLSDGCNGLIGQGAGVFLSPEIFVCELLEIYDAKKNKRSVFRACSPEVNRNDQISIRHVTSDRIKKMHVSFSGDTPDHEDISEEEAEILDLLGLSPISTEEICSRLPGSDFTGVSMLLMQLMIGGHVRQVSQGSYIRTYK